MARDVKMEAHYDRVVLLSPRKVPLPPRSTGQATTPGTQVRVRSAPSLKAPVVRVLRLRGTGLVVHEQVAGDTVAGAGRTTDTWDRVDGGFVSHAYVEFAP